MFRIIHAENALHYAKARAPFMALPLFFMHDHSKKEKKIQFQKVRV
jgi:hypothetical protein